MGIEGDSSFNIELFEEVSAEQDISASVETSEIIDDRVRFGEWMVGGGHIDKR